MNFVQKRNIYEKTYTLHYQKAKSIKKEM